MTLHDVAALAVGFIFLAAWVLWDYLWNYTTWFERWVHGAVTIIIAILGCWIWGRLIIEVVGLFYGH